MVVSSHCLRIVAVAAIAAAVAVHAALRIAPRLAAHPSRPRDGLDALGAAVLAPSRLARSGRSLTTLAAPGAGAVARSAGGQYVVRDLLGSTHGVRHDSEGDSSDESDTVVTNPSAIRENGGGSPTPSIAPSLFAYCRRRGKGGSVGSGLLHEAGNLVSLAALAATLRLDLVLFRTKLRRRHQLAYEPPAYLGPGADRWIDYSAFTANGRRVLIYEPHGEAPACPRCHHHAPTFWVGAMHIRTCVRPVRVRAVVPDGTPAAAWEHKPVLVWNEVRPQLNGLVGAALAGFLNATGVACALHASVTRAAQTVVRELLRGGNFAALHLRHGDVWRGSKGFVTAAHVAQLLNVSCARARVTCDDAPLYVASDAPQGLVTKLAYGLAHSRRVVTASAVRGLAHVGYTSRTYDLFVLEGEILALAAVRMTTFAQGDDGRDRAPFFHGALVPMRRRPDGMGQMCHQPHSFVPHPGGVLRPA